MDKRILKTKKALKDALLDLLRKKNFETVTTTEICEKAMISRNTFYNYYADKYALLEDCFVDFEDIFEEEFKSLQQKNNPEETMRQTFLNLLDTFLDTEQLYQSIPILSNFDLMALYYRAFMNILKKYEARYSSFMNPDYDYSQLNAFLVLGFWGFVHANPTLDRKTVRERTHKLILDLLSSPVFNGRPCRIPDRKA